MRKKYAYRIDYSEHQGRSELFLPIASMDESLVRIPRIELLENAAAHHYLRPAYAVRYGPGNAKDLIVWCDEHLCWQQHGCVPGEEDVVGFITARWPHHECVGGSLFYCMGDAPKEITELWRRYRPGDPSKFMPPPIRRVYLLTTATADQGFPAPAA